MTRADQENLDTLLDHIKRISYGHTTVKIGIHGGMIINWEEQDSRRGSKAPLRKQEEED